MVAGNEDLPESIFCTGLSLSTGQSSTLVFAGLGRMDQVFDACRIGVIKEQGGVLSRSKCGKSGRTEKGREERAAQKRDSNRKLHDKKPSIHCTVLLLSSHKTEDPRTWWPHASGA